MNSQIKDESSLGKLMHDFACIEAKDMYYPVLADRVRYFKEDEKGVTVMCKAMEDMRNEAVERNTVELLKNLMETMKMTAQQAVDALKIPLDKQSNYIAKL